MIPVWLLCLAAPFTFGVTLIPAAFIWLKLRTTEYGLTGQRVILKRGIIARRTQEMRSRAIETVEISQTVWGRIFGTGSVLVTGQGMSDVVFSNIDSPLDVKRAIEQSLASTR